VPSNPQIDALTSCRTETNAAARAGACTAVISSTVATTRDRAMAYVWRGTTFHDKLDYDGAIADYDSALALVPGLAEAFYERGYTKTARRDYDGAIADHTASIDARVYNLHLKGDQTRALAEVSDPIAAYGTESRGYYYRAVVVWARGEKAQALADFETAISMQPKAIYHFERGRLFQETGEPAKAIADYRRVLQLDPKYADAQDRLNRLEAKADAR
jgi:tetratricopeptide (TPR) repeat protein